MPNLTPLRAIRIPDDLWDAVGVKAAKENSDRSEVVRKLLSRWILSGNPQVSPRKG